MRARDANGSRAPWLLAWVIACGSDDAPAVGPFDGPPAERQVFVAVEGEGKIAAVEASSGAVRRSIDVSSTRASHGCAGGSERLAYDVHNVQGSADGKSVWVTAPPSGHTHGGGADELIAVDATTLQVTARIPLGEGVHASHVVLDGSTAFVTAYEVDAVLVVDTAARKVARSIALPPGTKPHGLRLTSDRKTLVIAGMGKKGSVVLADAETGATTSLALPGRAVQTATLPDGSAALVTVFDTKQVARVDLATREVRLFDMPAGSVGPVQLYPTPDGRYVWVADQGVLDGRPAGDRVVRMSAATGATDLSVKVAAGPHGVVMNKMGDRLFVTTLVGGTLDAVDAASGAVLWSTAVGAKPNGVTCLHAMGASP